MTDHAHRAAFRSTAWTTVKDALSEFLTAPCSPPGDQFFGEGSWTNEGVVVHQQGAEGIHAPDKALFDSVRLKYEPLIPCQTFEQAFRVLGAACARDWSRFDLECLRECCDAFRALELPAWVHDAKDRDPETFLVNEKQAMFTSLDMTWCTPEVVLERVRRMCSIGLDPCSNGRSIVRAKVEWRGPPGVDGLAEPWTGKGLVYVNPSYGREASQWVAKCAIEAMNGAEVILLVPARPDTAWWHEAIVPLASAICFWRGRLKFLGAAQGAPFPSSIVYYGSRVDSFAAAFGGAGWIVRDWRTT